MLADKVDYRHVCPARIVQIGKAVPETGAQVQKGACRFLGHARVAVRGSGDNAFE